MVVVEGRSVGLGIRGASASPTKSSGIALLPPQFVHSSHVHAFEQAPDAGSQ